MTDVDALKIENEKMRKMVGDMMARGQLPLYQNPAFREMMLLSYTIEGAYQTALLRELLEKKVVSITTPASNGGRLFKEEQ